VYGYMNTHKLCACQASSVRKEAHMSYSPMPDTLTLAGRMKEARKMVGVARLDENITPKRMAALVSERLGRPFHETQWRRYEEGTEPPLEIITVAASLSGLREEYIAFGRLPRMDETVVIDPARDRKLTDEEIERAKQEADRQRAARTSQAKRRRRGA